jgi:hypothetical protein
MPTVGVDCNVIIDGSGYMVKPLSYHMHQPRIRKATIRADGGEAYVDLGPGKRIWSMVILCVNDLVKYDGSSTGTTGQQYRDTIRASFTSSTGTTINFIEPIDGSTIPVHLDSYSELIIDLHSQITALAAGGSLAASYEVGISLIEA